MKKYLLTGGFATALLLGACGTDGEQSEETVAEETTEEQTEKSEPTEEVTEETTGEETTEEAAEVEDEIDEVVDEVEEPGSLAEANEELAGEDGLTEIYGYNDEEVTEEVGSLIVTRNSAVVFGMKLDEDTAWYFEDEGYSLGDEVQMITIEYTVENTVEDPRDFYLNQTTLITSTGEQIESEWLMDSGLQSEMLGAVKSTGDVTFLLRNSDADDIEWVDIIIPSLSDENYDIVSEEYKQRIEIMKE
ncbi:hypothetical protein ACFPFV_09450 [Salinicoccus siamensis]|uniref:DUF4352 domain-containing protein n=1 Tax=Salinicoccus siamensis TaxID=381830 RepID=A0ABV5Z446_9STAP